MKKGKEFLFILLIVGVLAAGIVYAWPNYYQNQVINSQGYYKTNETNVTWQPVTISVPYGVSTAITYKNGTWIGSTIGATQINYVLPNNAIMFGAYGCCNLNNASIWSQQYPCWNVTVQRYKEQISNNWSCGWNIGYPWS